MKTYTFLETPFLGSKLSTSEIFTAESLGNAKEIASGMQKYSNTMIALLDNGNIVAYREQYGHWHDEKAVK